LGTVGTATAAMILLYMGELIPTAPERLRGTLFSWSFEERKQTFDMYESTSKTSLDYLRKFLGSQGPLFAVPESSPHLCVGILTAQRRQSGKAYLVQLVGSLLTRMHLPSPNTYMHVFNVDPNPESHTEVSKVSDLLPVSILKGSHASTKDKSLTVKQQEALDYVAAMRYFDSLHCQHSLLLEDDAFASDRWVEQIQDALRQVQDTFQNWLFVRLYMTRVFARVPRGPQRIYKYDHYGTVAVLFSGRRMMEFANALERHVIDTLDDVSKFLPKDALLSVYSRDFHIPALTFEPVVFQHTGIHSTVNDRTLNKDFPPYMSARNFPSEGLPVVFNPSYIAIL